MQGGTKKTYCSFCPFVAFEFWKKSHMHSIYNIKKITEVTSTSLDDNVFIYKVTFQGHMVFRNWGRNRRHIGINSRKLESCIEYWWLFVCGMNNYFLAGIYTWFYMSIPKSFPWFFSKKIFIVKNLDIWENFELFFLPMALNKIFSLMYWKPRLEAWFVYKDEIMCSRRATVTRGRMCLLEELEEGRWQIEMAFFILLEMALILCP